MFKPFWKLVLKLSDGCALTPSVLLLRILGAFAEFRRATTSFVMSIHIEHLGSH